MAFKSDASDLRYYIHNLDQTVDERGSMFVALRKLQWYSDENDINPEKAKLDIRKYTITKEGEERPGKGVSFLTEEGPHELTKALVANGYGHTKNILQELRKREDFKESVEHLFDKEEDNDGEYFDMRSILLSEDPE